ncbi:PREDICTED: coiled-coil domain-containing protein 50, partial [Gekko japonicus]|uniref:Coiled-coil domain-containing protein 50 n=1 Tax=Gekko japonicus TaxID=146911 RepID=A0ABM1KFN4_GEKJA
CRDFAILEDHTLAHSLQEQESAKYHLANILNCNKLILRDLLEQEDCEIAQEIQVKLVIEAEQRRRQEEDDEDIARILQRKELQEEKRRMKPPPPAEPSRHSPYEDAPYQDGRGTKSKGAKEAAYQKPRVAGQDLEFYDAEIARKMQEEELLASHVDKRAAQVAQDEEIARLLMAEEKAAYRKAKEREKPSLDKRRQDQDWKHDTHELVHPRTREGHEGHRHRSDKPTRPPPPPTDDFGHLGSPAGPQISAHQSPKPDSSHKGYHYKQ